MDGQERKSTVTVMKAGLLKSQQRKLFKNLFHPTCGDSYFMESNCIFKKECAKAILNKFKKRRRWETKDGVRRQIKKKKLEKVFKGSV